MAKSTGILFTWQELSFIWATAHVNPDGSPRKFSDDVIKNVESLVDKLRSHAKDDKLVDTVIEFDSLENVTIQNLIKDYAVSLEENKVKQSLLPKIK